MPGFVVFIDRSASFVWLTLYEPLFVSVKLLSALLRGNFPENRLHLEAV